MTTRDDIITQAGDPLLANIVEIAPEVAVGDFMSSGPAVLVDLDDGGGKFVRLTSGQAYQLADEIRRREGHVTQ